MSNFDEEIMEEEDFTDMGNLQITVLYRLTHSNIPMITSLLSSPDIYVYGYEYEMGGQIVHMPEMVGNVSPVVTDLIQKVQNTNSDEEAENLLKAENKSSFQLQFLYHVYNVVGYEGQKTWNMMRSHNNSVPYVISRLQTGYDLFLSLGVPANEIFMNQDPTI